MSQEQLLERMRTNSIGTNKRTTNKFIKTKKVLNIAMSTILSVVIAMSMIGCTKSNIEDKSTIQQEYSEIYEDYGVHTKDIQEYEIERLEKALEETGLIDYTLNEDNLRDYHYTAEDYRKINNLDETYLRSFYSIASDQSVDEMAKALGYNNLHNYLESKGFLYQNGNIDGQTWAAYDSIQIAKIMSQEQEKGISK